MSQPEAPRFRDATPLARCFVVVAIAAAVLSAALAPETADLGQGLPEPVVALIILACSAVSVEVGWIVEGRARVEQRPHKALSLWAFAVVLAVFPAWLLLIVPVTYAHVYWRGLRPPLWKWAVSGAIVVLSAMAASETLALLPSDLTFDANLWTLLPILLAMSAFVATQSLLFLVMSRINHPEQEVWLRATLATGSFYVTEISLLSVGALSVLVWSKAPWMGLLLIPVYGFVQQAVVYEPLRTEATIDGKTGLLRYEPWRAMCVVDCSRLNRAGRPWAVILLDLDHFSSYNELHGHLGGDEALAAVAAVLRDQTRAPDRACRFGGEEFAVLLLDSTPVQAEAAAERLRAAVGHLPGPPLTLSAGVATVDPSVHGRIEIGAALTVADRALYAAKAAGRDRVVVDTVAARTQDAPLADDVTHQPSVRL